MISINIYRHRHEYKYNPVWDAATRKGERTGMVAVFMLHATKTPESSIANSPKLCVPLDQDVLKITRRHLSWGYLLLESMFY